MSHVVQEIRKIYGGGREGDPPSTPGSFCKVSNLMHTFGVLDDMQPVRKELEGEGVKGGILLPHRGDFAFFRVLNKRSGAYFG